MWLSEVNKSIDNYLQTKKLIDEMIKYIGEPAAEKDSPVTLLPVIKKLISMLNSSSQSFESLQSVWTLALRSLRTVEVSHLVESQILEMMIDAFLNSEDKIQQTTYTQILRISESIARSDKNGRFLCRLLFKTLDSIKTGKASDSVVIGIC